MIRNGDQVTRQQALDELDNLRDGFTHNRDCELPGRNRRCQGCADNYTVSRVVRDLHDGDTLADVIRSAETARHALPYGIGCTVLDIVHAISE